MVHLHIFAIDQPAYNFSNQLEKYCKKIYTHLQNSCLPPCKFGKKMLTNNQMCFNEFYYSRWLLKVPSLFPWRTTARLQWAQKYKNWLLPYWPNVLFTNETRVSVYSDSRRVRVQKDQEDQNDSSLQEKWFHIKKVV